MAHLHGTAKMLLIFVDETDRHESMPLYEAIMRRLMRRDIAGATVLRGIMGYGAQNRLFGSSRILGIADNRPVTIMVVDTEARIASVIPEIKELVPEGLILVMDTFVEKYAAQEK
jgi:PII-like signaling protein